jgi:acetyl esterase/lipase
MHRLLIILASLTLLLTGRSLADGDTVQHNVTYETVDAKDIVMDIAVPDDAGKYPLVICIHGGAWRGGDKSKFTWTIENLARHGYVAATINYRLAPKYHWPTQLDDAKAALLFLKAHASQFKIDPTHIAALGESAGAQMAMLLAFHADPANATPLTSTHLQAVVNYYGPVDLKSWQPSPIMEFIWQRQFHQSIEQTMGDFFGSNDPDSPQVKSASPINFVDKNCPPVLTFHGTLDPVVPFHQAELLNDALKKAGVSSELVPIQGGMHGGWTPEARADAAQRAIAFLNKTLKGIEAPPPAPPKVVEPIHAAAQ